MRLLDLTTMYLREFSDIDVPKYGVLSHRWIDEKHEVTFRGSLDGAKRDSKGYAKRMATCKQASAQNYNWAWFDSDYIGKSSGAEFSEAIDSKLCRCRHTAVCYVDHFDNSPGSTESTSLLDHAHSVPMPNVSQQSIWLTRARTASYPEAAPDQQEMILTPEVKCFMNEFVEALKGQILQAAKQNESGSSSLPPTRESRFMGVSDMFVGDEGFGPNFGGLEMGREEDDDDDCVGFHRLALSNDLANLLTGTWSRHALSNKARLPTGYLKGVIPKFGPPKRDPVAAKVDTTMNNPVDEKTLQAWRDAIARTCWEGIGMGSMKDEKGAGWISKDDWIDFYAKTYEERGLLTAH
jgi:hypothetical protein